MTISRIFRAVSVCLIMAMVSLLHADTPAQLVAAGSGVYPVDEMMTILPGPACPYPDGVNGNDVADHDYGGAGSRCVASSSAHAYSPSEGIDHEAKGLFQTILRFNSSAMPVSSMNSLSLDLFILNGNQSAFDLYNYRGSAGYFTVSLVYDGWNTGVGSPHDALPTIVDPLVTDAYKTDPLTHNNLDAMLENESVVELTTLYYDAAVPYSSGAVWYSFNISDVLNNVAFQDALNSGATFSLLLSPTWIDENNDLINDNEVAFNFASRTQYNLNGTVKLRNDSVALTYTAVPEPACIMVIFTGLTILVSNARRKNNPTVSC